MNKNVKCRILFAMLFALPVFLLAQVPKPVETDTVWVSGVPMVFIKVEGGTFSMGATSEQSVAADSDEKPVHKVTLTGFYIAQTEVTQELWQKIMDNNPSTIKGNNRPVHNVSWYDCMDFIEALNAISGKKFRMPTEAEWEYAARGGNRSKGFKFAGGNNAEKFAWNAESSGTELYFVKTKQPNELGLYDMGGNAYEWCGDLYGAYSDKAQNNPQGMDIGESRVLRGGSWQTPRNDCRVSNRHSCIPYDRREDYGLRLAVDSL